MKLELKEFITTKGEVILYNGHPDFALLEKLSEGSGDIWHSSFEQGYKNAFPELVYQTAVFFWYLNDFDGLSQCVSWRVNPHQFAVRKNVWEITGGFDPDFKSIQAQALDYGYRSLHYLGAIPLYVKGLFTTGDKEEVSVSPIDRHIFFRKNFKGVHSVYMVFRSGIWRLPELYLFFKVRNHFSMRKNFNILPPRELNEIEGNPTVSYIIPTMLRQDFTLQLLVDLSKQKYPPSQVVIVDATPESERDENIYFSRSYPFELVVQWQQTKGSCRARNEAIAICTGEYIVFGDDDIRVPDDFIQNHIRVLQTYSAGACNGLDIRADHQNQDFHDLSRKLFEMGTLRWKLGVTGNFSNANSCVKREYVTQLVGNDINFDGGYGEDGDFGLSLAKIGVTVLFNPFSTNLHLKPPAGGYRWWGSEAGKMGTKRKAQPWELDTPVRYIRPVPSPTVMYGVLKQFKPNQVREYKYKNFLYFLMQGPKVTLPLRILKLPYKNLQFNKSLFYSRKLLKLGIRHQ
ncbi:MAG: family 2 glycosyl transferase [Flavobacterium sp. BFFFF1]|uniref:glycosyltransferase family 2 protein n=1 Tax=Flavobacterium sp. BFFFF1 TaxID=2015557 RepID=UPI000BCEA2B8|nr:glycosyltransferase family 2 protein [Flavobacterium sp. BFFFF1]OYU80806.1 MAG: family 2 glycosyl transferase [Flavobacterium sp. BFFFF1]